MGNEAYRRLPFNSHAQPIWLRHGLPDAQPVSGPGGGGWDSLRPCSKDAPTALGTHHPLRSIGLILRVEGSCERGRMASWKLEMAAGVGDWGTSQSGPALFAFSALPLPGLQPLAEGGFSCIWTWVCTLQTIEVAPKYGPPTRGLASWMVCTGVGRWTRATKNGSSMSEASAQLSASWCACLAPCQPTGFWVSLACVRPPKRRRRMTRTQRRMEITIRPCPL